MANSNTVLTTRSQGVSAAARFLEGVQNTAAHSYYLFVGNCTGQQNAVPDVIDASQKTSTSDVYQQMQFGKKIAANNAQHVVRNVVYQSGVVYDMYDDIDPLLMDKNFYVHTTAGSFHHIFKCLDNNLGANSSIQPNFSDIVGSNTEVYQTSDGYRWKYMYSFDNTANDMFSSSNYIPVLSNTTVTAAVTRGAIDVIRIEDVGRGYDNFVTGTFTSGDLRINGDSTIYQISNATASTVNGFYTGCGLYISSGTGAGQYKRVTDYISNSNGNFVVISSFFSINPTNGSQFEIYPNVIVKGDGRQTTTCVARALINASASNSVYRVEILDRGSTYNFATANVIANDVVSVIRSAELRPIMPPRRGHGYNPFHELGANRIALYAQLANTEANTIPSTNQFRQVGIVEDPLFSNVVVNVGNRSGSFLAGEVVRSITPLRVGLAVTVTGANVSSNTGIFTKTFNAQDKIYLVSNGVTQFYGQVNTVVNTSFLTLTSNCSFNSVNTELYVVTNSNFAGIVSTFDGASNVSLSSVPPVFSTGSFLCGEDSSAVANVNTSYRQNVAKTDFSTFVQMFKYIGSVTFGTFINSETVYQTSIDTANAIMHSATLSSGTLTMYTTNQTGRFALGTSVVGNTSSALAAITTKYFPEVIPDSGKVLYVENRTPVVRQAGQTETFKIVIDF